MKTKLWRLYYGIKNWLWKYIPFHGVTISDAPEYPYNGDFSSEFISHCTCMNCDWKTNGCEYAFDAYNTNGDCLAVK